MGAMTTKKKTNKGRRVLFLRDLETGLQGNFRDTAHAHGLTQSRAFYGLLRHYCEDPGEFPVKKRDRAGSYTDKVFLADLPPEVVAVFKSRTAGRGNSMREVAEALMREFVKDPKRLAKVIEKYSVKSSTYKRC
jgi:hypothetical protein